MIKEHDQVVLTQDLPEHGLFAGDLGVVIMMHGDHAEYELEIFSANGRTIDVVTVDAHQVRAVSRRDVLHVRELVA
ncbi:MAG: DUF4926 domain-containing protein [Caldilineaceae bacterium]